MLQHFNVTDSIFSQKALAGRAAMNSKMAEVEEKMASRMQWLPCIHLFIYFGKCVCIKVASRDFVKDGFSKPCSSNDFLLLCYTVFFFTCSDAWGKVS